MMDRLARITLVAALLMLLVCCCSIPAQEKPSFPSTKDQVEFNFVESEQARKLGRITLVCYTGSQKNSKEVKRPDVKGVLVGQQTEKNGRYACVIPAKDPAKVGTLIIDMNNNRDLTDDTRYDLPAMGKRSQIKIPVGGTEYEFELSCGVNRYGKNGARQSIHYYPQTGEGTGCQVEHREQDTQTMAASGTRSDGPTG